jgi:hypothetical protein
MVYLLLKLLPLYLGSRYLGLGTFSPGLMVLWVSRWVLWVNYGYYYRS